MGKEDSSSPAVCAARRYLVSRHAPSIKHHVDDVLWSCDSVLTTLKGDHDDESNESDEPMSPDESAPASRETHARDNFSQRLSLLSGR